MVCSFKGLLGEEVENRNRLPSFLFGDGVGDLSKLSQIIDAHTKVGRKQGSRETALRLASRKDPLSRCGRGVGIAWKGLERIE